MLSFHIFSISFPLTLILYAVQTISRRSGSAVSSCHHCIDTISSQSQPLFKTYSCGVGITGLFRFLLLFDSHQIKYRIVLVIARTSGRKVFTTGGTRSMSSPNYKFIILSFNGCHLLKRKTHQVVARGLPTQILDRLSCYIQPVCNHYNRLHYPSIQIINFALLLSSGVSTT